MKKILLVTFVSLIVSGCNNGDENEFTFQILCKAKYGNSDVTCQFYFFETDEYISVERNDLEVTLTTYGKATATKTDGTTVESIGYAIFFASEGYGVAKYRNSSQEIQEGIFYVACFPSRYPGRTFPYKAKIFTKEKNHGLIIEPIFTDKSMVGVDGYKYFEWDE